MKKIPALAVLAALLSPVPALNAGQPAPALPPAVTVFAAGENGYAGYRIPVVIRTANGDLLAFAEARRDGLGDAGDIDLVQKRSTDGGLSWGAAQTVWDDAANTCGNPCPVLDETTGVLWLLLTHNQGADRERDIIAQTAAGTRTVWVARSDDHGKTWTAPVNITATTKDPAWGWYATGPGVGVQLKRGPRKGRLVIPCDHSETTADSTRRSASHAIYSDDHGKTWRLGASIRPAANECQLAEIASPDGGLLMNMRRSRDKQYLMETPQAAQKLRGTATSADGGETWSAIIADNNLPEPVCQAALIRHSWPRNGQPGLLLFSNPASKTAREKMTVRFSWDDGATWPRSLLLHAGFSAYSSLASLSDNEAACLYERGGDPKNRSEQYREIVFQRFPVPDAPARQPGL
ncbi:MAG: glycoside hydrolase [Opitutaceae bacterium]|jgi:sialidase-1|nr:glycoside hydrolase [Opitutaceae bacterium]